MNSYEKRVLRIIGDDVDAPDAFSDITQIRESINDSIEEVCIMASLKRDTYHLTLIQDRTFYRLNFSEGQFGYVYSAFLPSKGRKLDQIDVETLSNRDPWWLKNSGEVVEYFQIIPDVIGINRKPGSSGDVLELSCVALPQRYSSDVDPIQLRDQFLSATISFAVSEYYASRGDAVRATKFHKEYLEYLGMTSLNPEMADREWKTFLEHRYGQLQR